MKRVGIFVFYDRRGKVHRYVPHFLREIKKCMDRIVIVVNGELNEDGEKILSEFSNDIVIRENKGFDTWGYKAGMDYLGWQKLADYDEVVLFNDTIMGPVYPFTEMFEEMDSKDVDFWGITEHYRDEANPYGCEEGYTPEHIQSYFMAVRNKMFCDDEFKSYWDNLFEIDSYEDAVGKHEILFTDRFAKKGFKWEAYVDSDGLRGRHTQPIIAYPDLLVKSYKCPVFKKRVFFQDYEWINNSGVGNAAHDLLEFLKENDLYPVEYIVDSLIDTQNIRRLHNNFHWTYVVEDKIQKRKLSSKSLMVFMTAEKENEDEMNRLAKLLPSEVDVVKIDAKSYLQGLKEVVKKSKDYQYVGFFHDLPTKQSAHTTVEEAVFLKEKESLLASEEYISNLLCLLEDEKTLGMVSTLDMTHSFYVTESGNAWKEYYDLAREWFEKLSITIPISDEISPMLVNDLQFMAKGKAIDAIGEYLIKIIDSVSFDEMSILSTEDTPYESISQETKAYRLLERIIPYLLQQKEYHIGYVTNKSFSAIEIDNLKYQLSERYLSEQRCYNAGLNYLQQLKDCEEELKDCEEELANEKAKCEELRIHYMEAMYAMRHEVDDLLREIEQMKNSRSWKITKPIRSVTNAIKGDGEKEVKRPWSEREAELIAKAPSWLNMK